ncbi:MAG: hypothetical protein ABI793_06735, partial [Flavobacterium sp.]
AHYANRLEELLAELQIQAWNFNTQVAPGDTYIEKAKSALESCSHIFVFFNPLPILNPFYYGKNITENCHFDSCYAHIFFNCIFADN